MSRLKPTAATLGSLFLDLENDYEITKNGTIVLGRTDFDWNTQKEAQQFLDDWMPPEEWLTEEYIKQEAGKGLKEALMCSIIHWRQIVLEIEEAEIRDEYCGGYCGLCQHFNMVCSRCVLNKILNRSCCREWHKFDNNPTLKNAIAMHNLLVNKYNELFGENDMKDEILKIDGVDVSVSTIKNALKQAGIKLEKYNIPNVIEVGQVYKLMGMTRMVVTIGYEHAGMTDLDPGYVGCFNGNIPIVTKEADLRDYLIRNKAEYLGKFYELYKKV